MANEQQTTFAIQRIYLKDASYETPNAPGIFLKEWNPEVNVEMDNSVNTLSEDNNLYDVQFKITVTAQIGGDIAYIAEVVQSGIFLITGFEKKDRQRLTGSVCPDTLYPYAREALSNLMIKGGFPPFILTPVNFDYIYNKRLAESHKHKIKEGAATGETQ